MTLNEMKEHFFNEATELGLASETDIERLCIWLERNGYDSDLAYSLWANAAADLEFMLLDAMAEFA